MTRNTRGFVWRYKRYAANVPDSLLTATLDYPKAARILPTELVVPCFQLLFRSSDARRCLFGIQIGSIV